MRNRRPPGHRDGLTRRALLKTTLGAAAAGIAPDTAHAQEPVSDTTKRWGRLPNILGARSPAENPRRTPSPTSSRTPLQDLHGTIPPADTSVITAASRSSIRERTGSWCTGWSIGR